MPRLNQNSPGRRRLRIYATDPMSGRRSPYRIVIDIENEPELQEGPSGSLIEVVDYDGWNRLYYAPVDLNDSALLMDAGLAPSESNPKFHQQMVYAVAMKVIETAKHALGRPLTFDIGKHEKLKLLPHAFYGRNAYFDPVLNAILFGYFEANSDAPGPNIPGQTIFTCLSHDIIAHEMTHAIVHRLRRYFIEPSNLDVRAFHEAFSDIVALFHRFSYRDLLRDYISASRGDLRKSPMLVELAQQFGHAMGTGKPLRSAMGIPLGSSGLPDAHESHARGEYLVGAVFKGFFDAFDRRTADLFRIAGSRLDRPSGRLHPDLVDRLASEAAQLADRFLRACFRAFDYMPPVDVTYGDFLRALVTSDYELNPDDPDEVRYAIIEGFREYGIYPVGVQSLAEDSLLWPSQVNGRLTELPLESLEVFRRVLTTSVTSLDQERATRRSAKRSETSQNANTAFQQYSLESVTPDEESQTPGGRNTQQRYSEQSLKALKRQRTSEQDDMYRRLHSYAAVNLEALGLDPAREVAVVGFHAVQRVGKGGNVLVEYVAQFMQTDRSKESEFGGLPFRGGATVIFGSQGEVRYIAGKPMPFDRLPDNLKRAANNRLQAARDTIEVMDLSDPRLAMATAEELADRMARRACFRAFHGEG